MTTLVARLRYGTIVAIILVALAATSQTAALNTTSPAQEHLSSALADLDALLADGSDGDVQKQLSLSRDELLTALEELNAPCRATAITRLRNATSAAQKVPDTERIIQNMADGGRLLVTESMEVLKRRVGDRDPRTDEVLTTFNAADEELDTLARLGLLHSAEGAACNIFDDGPRLLFLAREPARVTTLSYYSLRQLSETAMPAALGQAGATLTGTGPRHAVALDHRRGIAVTLDPTLPEAASATVFGSARLLAQAEDAARYAVADLRQGAVRIFDPSEGEVAQVAWSAPPVALALSPDGTTVANANALGKVVVQKTSDDEIALDLDDAFVWSLAFGASAEEVFAVTSDAVVKRVSVGDGLLATSDLMPGLRECKYLAGLERVGVLMVKADHTTIELLRGDDLSPLSRVDFSGIIDQPGDMTTVGGRDLIVRDANTTAIVDGSTGDIIESIDHDTTVTLGIAPAHNEEMDS